MNARQALEETAGYFEAIEPLELAGLKAASTALLMVDMINGFAVSGALSSGRVKALIPVIESLSKKCGVIGIKKIAFADRHTSYSAEFATYPPHCVEGTPEAEMVDELKSAGDYTLIPKNSTNGFLEEEFLRWLGRNPEVDTFIIVGDCTDICILQLALTLKAHFNRLNQSSRIIVPKNAVDTYDAPRHNAELMHVIALYNMMINGIEIVDRII
jgi:nicotinamidase-related amidase